MKNSYFVESSGNKRQQDLRRIRLQSRKGFNAYTKKFLNSLEIKKIKIALDIGSGAGECLPYIARYAEKIIALDGDPERLKLAEAVIKEHGLENRVTKIVSSITSIDLPDSSVGLIYSRLFWQHLTDAARNGGGQEAIRVLRPGGWFIAEDLDIPTWGNEPESQAHKVLGQSLLKLYGKKGTEPRMGLKLKDFFESLGLKIFSQGSYQIKSRGKDPFKQAHVEIFKTTRPEILKAKMISRKKFDENLRIYESEVSQKETLTIAPIMYQMAARKI